MATSTVDESVTKGVSTVDEGLSAVDEAVAKGVSTVDEAVATVSFTASEAAGAGATGPLFGPRLRNVDGEAAVRGRAAAAVSSWRGWATAAAAAACGERGEGDLARGASGRRLPRSMAVEGVAKGRTAAAEGHWQRSGPWCSRMR